MLEFTIRRTPVRSESTPILRGERFEEDGEIPFKYRFTESGDISRSPSRTQIPESPSSSFDSGFEPSQPSSENTPLLPSTIPETSMRQRLAQTAQRVFNQFKPRTPQDLDQQARETFKRDYNTYIKNIGKNGALLPPDYYKKGMQILADKILSPAGTNVVNSQPLSEAELMLKSSSFSNEERHTFFQLQEYLQSKMANELLDQPEWWTFKQSFCITIEPEIRTQLLDLARKYPAGLLENPQNLPLSAWRRSLKEAENFPPKIYKNFSIQSKWEKSAGILICHPIDETIERIENRQIEIITLIKRIDDVDLQEKLDSPPRGINDVIRNPSASPDETPIESNIHLLGPNRKTKYPKKAMEIERKRLLKENKALSDLRLTLEDMRDSLIRVAGGAFGRAVQPTAESPSESEAKASRMVRV